MPLASVKLSVATWCDEWRRAHKFAELNVKLAFVFDGFDNGLKKIRRLERQEATRKWKQAATDAQTWQQLDKAKGHLARVNGHVIRAFCDWARDTLNADEYVLLGAPFEADAQLVKLEIDGFTNGTLTEDTDLFFYEGSQNMYSGFNTRSTRKYRCVVNRSTAVPFLSTLRGHSLRAITGFCGTDYIDHLSGVGPKTAFDLHKGYTSTDDPTDYLNQVGQSHSWSKDVTGNKAEDFAHQFNRNCRLFKFFPVFHLHVQAGGDDKVSDFMHGRFTVTLDTFLPPRDTEGDYVRRLFGDTFVLPDDLCLDDCAKMNSWARGESLAYPPLPTIPGIGEVPYQAACNFDERPPRLWAPPELRLWLKSRHYHVTSHHQMQPSLHPTTMEPLRGLVELVEEHLSLPDDHQPQPLSTSDAEQYGSVDPAMWNQTDNHVLTLKNNMEQVLTIVNKFKITDQTILDRYV